MTIWPVAEGVAWRALKNVFTNPSLFLPTLIFPLFFFTAFAGGLSAVDSVPGFDYEPGYTGFQFCFVLLQSAAFGGVFTGFGIARDFEYAFARRLLIAAPNRSGIILGYAIAALVRWLVTATMLTTVALIVGHERRRRAGRRFRSLRARDARQRGGAALGVRHRDALPLDPGRADDADARLPDPLLRAGVRAAQSAHRLDRGRGHASIRSPRCSRPPAASWRGIRTHVLLAFGVAIGLGLAFALWAFRGLRTAEAAG